LPVLIKIKDGRSRKRKQTAFGNLLVMRKSIVDISGSLRLNLEAKKEE